MKSHRQFINQIFRVILIFCLVSVYLGILPPQPVRAAQYVVTSDADDGPGSLRAIVGAAIAGDIITFSSSLDGTTITLLSEIVIDKSLQISGSNNDPMVTLSGNDSSRVFNITSTGELSLGYIIIANGSATNGGGILNEGNLYSHMVHYLDNAATNGGAIYNTGYIYLADNILSGNTATNGGAVYQNNTTVQSRINRSTLTNNTASNSGGALYVNTSTDFEVTNSTFYNNSATNSGGGLFNLGLAYLKMSTLSDNSAASSRGGGLNNAPGSTLQMFNTIIANSSPGSGDCVNGGTISTNDNNLVEDNSCSPAVSGDPGLLALTFNGGYTDTMALGSGSPAIDTGRDLSCVEDQRVVDRPHGEHCDIGAFEAADGLVVNSTTDPGDGKCDDTQCTLREAIQVAANGDTITFNSPTMSGNTITLGSSSTFEIVKDLTLDGSALDANLTLNGDSTYQIMEINKGAVATVKHLNFVDGTANTGGAIEILNNSEFSCYYCKFEANNSNSGGAIYNNNSDLNLYDSYFYNNNATVNNGGAIGSYEGLNHINTSTFEDNHANDFGGAIFNSDGDMTIINSTIYHNDALLNGGGIYNFNGDLSLFNNTLSANYAPSGGGGIYSGGTTETLHLYNTIIANSASGGDCLGTISGNVNNLIEDGSCSSALSGDPGLGSLTDNGGPTATMGIDDSSLAFDAGDDATCESIDQRGIIRPQESHCDIGAFELEVFYPEMDVLGNSQSIVDGDSTPSLSDHTDFGTGFLGSSPVTRTFTIENTGGEQLNLTSNPDFVQVAGTHAADFTVTGQPSSPVAAGGGTSTFTISFSPAAIGLREAQIIIANDDNDENPYTFSIQGTGSDGTFSDVTSAHWAFKYIEAIADAGLTSGYPDGTYRPENRVTRAEMAVFLLNALGISPGPLPVDPSFSDIELHWAETFIEELADQGITGGYPDGTYRPENRVTRAEMAVFLLNALGISPGPLPVDSSFSDIEGHWAEIFIEELADQGITGGYPDGTYRPENRVTRAEMAVFLVNTFNIPLP